MRHFHDITALITGGTRGIGRAMVEHLADAGARVYTCARDEASLDQLRTATRDLDGEVIAERADVTNADEIASLVESHETMCEKTRWLRSHISAEPEEIAELAESILDVLQTMTDLLAEHTEEENRIFEAALEKMPEDEQQELLDEMRKI